MHDDATRDDQLARHKPSRLSRLLRWQVAVPSILFVLVILAPVVYRQWRLSQVPNIGDPFPVSEILKPIPEEENAFPLFEEAFALLKEVADADAKECWDEERDGWDPTDNQLNKYLTMNRPALEKWREATEKKNYQIVPIAKLSEVFYITKIQASRDLIRWCQLEIERLTKTGKPSKALSWLRASFRFSGLEGIPGFDTDPPLGSKLETWLLAEPEFSRLLVAHLTANLLVSVDDPRRDRPPLLDGYIFDESAVGVMPAGHLPAYRLIDVLKDSMLIDANTASLLDSIDREQARRACLQVALAAQAYYRDRGEFPDRLADLRPDYLSSLPDDPYAPQPMPVIYRRSGDEAVIYSLFTNEIDDGGTTVTYDEAKGEELYDFGFRIRTPRNLPVVAPRP